MISADLILSGIVSFETIFSPESWFDDDDFDLAAEILNLKQIRELASAPDE